MQDSDTETKRTVIHHRGNSACQYGKPRDAKAVPGQMGREKAAWSPPPEEPWSDTETGWQPGCALTHSHAQPDTRTHTHIHTVKIGAKVCVDRWPSLSLCPHCGSAVWRKKIQHIHHHTPPVSETSTQAAIKVQVSVCLSACVCAIAKKYVGFFCLCPLHVFHDCLQLCRQKQN